MKLVKLGLAVLMVMGMAHNASAQELKLGVGLSLPPYIIQEGDTGIEVEVIRGALPADAKIKLVYLPFARVKVSLSDGSTDAITPVNEAAGIKDAVYSDSHITYQNVAVSLKSKGIKVGSIADLGKLRIVAFQDATLYLGKDYAAMAKGNPNYTEFPSQENQVKMLFSERADVIVMDINIYKYFKSKIKDVDVSKEVTIAEIFPATEYKVAFKSKEAAAQFNAGLAKLKSSGKYAAIINKYTK
jgi:polar amino acid transport system substrate-binding protein